MDLLLFYWGEEGLYKSIKGAPPIFFRKNLFFLQRMSSDAGGRHPSLVSLCFMMCTYLTQQVADEYVRQTSSPFPTLKVMIFYITLWIFEKGKAASFLLHAMSQ